jgi:hypothetical protein
MFATDEQYREGTSLRAEGASSVFARWVPLGWEPLEVQTSGVFACLIARTCDEMDQGWLALVLHECEPHGGIERCGVCGVCEHDVDTAHTSSAFHRAKLDGFSLFHELTERRTHFALERSRTFGLEVRRFLSRENPLDVSEACVSDATLLFG